MVKVKYIYVYFRVSVNYSIFGYSIALPGFKVLFDYDKLLLLMCLFILNLFIGWFDKCKGT